jgi:hypothetical protein
MCRDCTHRRYRYKDRIDEVERAKNRIKSTVRSKVEHVFCALSRTEEEMPSKIRGVRAGASVLAAEKTAASRTSFARHPRLIAGGRRSGPVTAEQANPNACCGMAKQLVPKSRGLFRVSLDRRARTFVRVQHNRCLPISSAHSRSVRRSSPPRCCYRLTR